MSWEEFLDKIADAYGLSITQKETFIKSFADGDEQELNNTKIADKLHIGITTLEKRLKEIYSIFSQNCDNIGSGKKGQFTILRSWLKQRYVLFEATGEIPSLNLDSSSVDINWPEICQKMLEPQRQLSSNLLLHTDEDCKHEREQIYVPLALVERKKPDKRKGGVTPDAGTKLYKPQYEEKQRFEHEAFLKQILEIGKGKTKGKKIALIGEPGAGKTTLLQTIAYWILKENLGLPIWISLADLGQQATVNIWQYLKSDWLSRAFPPSQQEIAKTELEKQIEQRKIWLLLDGVDEVAASGMQTLQTIANQLRGWFQPRVILTCRLNVWEADKNALADFETYRLLDFDYPTQVHQFIDNWFIKSDFDEKKEKLKTELKKPEKVRLRDLIQNPLRLTLLCASWQSQEGNLPETKAGLYAQFVEQFFNWKCDRFPITYQEKTLLNQALGRLALQDIDTGTTRFRLRESYIRNIMKDQFEKALELGWLNTVGIAAESPTQEKVYAFFHPSFEEYFAALAVEDWDYFLPRNHEDKPVEGKPYRIFQPQWKEVILLWLGREDVDKEGFVKALVEFKDECGEWNLKEVDRGFYDYQAYLLAGAGVHEFKAYSRADEIVANIVGRWSFGYFDSAKEKWTNFLYLIENTARAIVPETDRSRAIAGLIKVIETTEDKFTRRQAAESLGTIDPGNKEAIAALIDLLKPTEDKFTRRQAAYSLGTIGTGNKDAIAALIKVIESTEDESTRRQAAESLEKIDPGNQEAITALIKVIESTEYESTRRQAALSLGTIDPGNQEAIAALIELLKLTKDLLTRRQAAESLGRIDPGNLEAITALIELLKLTKNELTRGLAANRLEEIIQDNQRAGIVATLKECLLFETYENDFDRFQNCYNIIWKCAQTLPYPDFYQAWHNFPIT